MKMEIGNKGEDVQTAIPSVRKTILDALGAEGDEDERSLGCPNSPVLPLFGSLNVPISPKEEEIDE